MRNRRVAKERIAAPDMDAAAGSAARILAAGMPQEQKWLKQFENEV